MIDLHCHILPGIDDGANDLEQSLHLARLAVADGITHAVATPHIHPGRYDNTLETITKAYRLLKLALEVKKIPLQLGMAAEVRYSAEILTMVTANQLPFLGQWQGEKVLLLEMPHQEVPPGIEQLVRWLVGQGIRPMIAHPERNKDILRDYNRIKPLAQEGCLFQLTAGAVAGHFGEPVKQLSKQILEANLATILATDAHNTERRPPVLEAGRRAAEAILGESKSWELVQTTPAQIAKPHF
jgi:protein-tyrosine phosphatase